MAYKLTHQKYLAQKKVLQDKIEYYKKELLNYSISAYTHQMMAANLTNAELHLSSLEARWKMQNQAQ